MIIAIEGNIGAGKSTLLAKLENVVFNKDHIVMYEPVEEWMSIKPEGQTVSLFEKYYSDKEKYGFMFQMYALQTRLMHLTKILVENPDKIIICERTHLTDYEIFAKMLYQDKILDDYEYYVYKSWYDHAASTLHDSINGIVYLCAEPYTCMTRIAKRNRIGEDAIAVNYVNKIHKLHESWLVTETKLPCVKINGNVDEHAIDINAIVDFINKVSGGAA